MPVDVKDSPMPVRKSAASSTQSAPRKRKPTAAEISAGRANLAKGRAKKQEMAEQAEGRDSAAERWAKLLDGTLTVEDLDDEEIARMSVRAKDGTMARARKLPSHIAQKMRAESIRRAQEKFRTAAPEAVAELIKIGQDPDVKDSDRIKALQYVVDRALGKTPETIRVEGASRFDAMLDDAVDVDREMADLAREASGEDAAS